MTLWSLDLTVFTSLPLTVATKRHRCDFVGAGLDGVYKFATNCSNEATSL